MLTIQFASLISSLINIISLHLTTFHWAKVRGIAPRSHTGRPRTCLVIIHITIHAVFCFFYVFWGLINHKTIGCTRKILKDNKTVLLLANWFVFQGVFTIWVRLYLKGVLDNQIICTNATVGQLFHHLRFILKVWGQSAQSTINLTSNTVVRYQITVFDHLGPP